MCGSDLGIENENVKHLGKARKLFAVFMEGIWWICRKPMKGFAERLIGYFEDVWYGTTFTWRDHVFLRRWYEV